MNLQRQTPTLFVVRHPETESNVEGRYQGSTDTPFTENGKSESLIFARDLLLPSVDHIYHAENFRTRYLAEVIARKFPRGILHSDPRLNERDGGSHEGKLYADIYSGYDVNDVEARFKRTPPFGESYETLSVRVNDFLDAVRRNHAPVETILCITSSGVIRSMMRQTRKLSLKEMFDLKIPNLSLWAIWE